MQLSLSILKPVAEAFGLHAYQAVTIRKARFWGLLLWSVVVSCLLLLETRTYIYIFVYVYIHTSSIHLPTTPRKPSPTPIDPPTHQPTTAL